MVSERLFDDCRAVVTPPACKMQAVAANAMSDVFAVFIGAGPFNTLAQPRQPTRKPQKEAAATTSPGTSVSSPPHLKLVQHEVSWTIQCYLRMVDVPYDVENTPYHRLEGGSAAYPLLIDDRTANSDVIFYIPSPIRGGGGGYSYLRETQLPSSPDATPLPKKSDCDVVGSEILSHLRRSLKDIDSEIDSFQTEAWLSLLDSVLSPILLALTFGDDGPGYTTFRSRWLSASQTFPTPSTPSRFPSPLSFFFGIASSLRLFAEKSSVITTLRPPGGLGGGVIPPSPLRSRSSGHPAVDVPVALSRASRAYAALSSQLFSPGPYMFGRASPSLTDAVLFGHVAGALMNPHLSPVVQSFPALMQHFRQIADTFFPNISAPSALLPDGSVRPPSRFADADFVNESNAFCALRDSYLLASGVMVAPSPPTPRDPRRFRLGNSDLLDMASAREERKGAKKEKGDNENRVWFAAVGLLIVGFFVSNP